MKDDRGHTYMEIPLVVASVGVIAAPVVAAVGAIAALVAHFDILVERGRPDTAPPQSPPPAADPGAGASGNKGA